MTASLRDRVDAALVELGALRSTDPAARRAILAVRLTAHTLQTHWLRALQDQDPP